MKNTYKVSVRKPEGKKALGRARSRWEELIKMGVKEIWLEGGN
jgi:hypothetical protein